MRHLGISLVVSLCVCFPALAAILDVSTLSLAATIHTRGEYDNYGLDTFNGAPLSLTNQPTTDDDQLSADWKFYTKPAQANELFITASNVFDSAYGYISGPPFEYVALTGFSFSLTTLAGIPLNAIFFSNAYAVPGEALAGPDGDSVSLATTPGWSLTNPVAQPPTTLGTPAVDNALTHFSVVTGTTRILGGAAFELAFDSSVDLAADADFNALTAQAEFGLGRYRAPGTLTYVAPAPMDVPEPPSLWLMTMGATAVVGLARRTAHVGRRRDVTLAPMATAGVSAP